MRKKDTLVLFLLLQTIAFGQAVSVKEISLPTGSASIIQGLATSPDGRVWLVSQPNPASHAASLLMQASLGSSDFQTITAVLDPFAFEERTIMGNVVRMDPFFPQNGTASVFGPGAWIGTAFQDFEWEASPAGFKQMCTGYTVDGTGQSPAIRSGPFFGSDGGKYYVGTTGQSSTIYLRGNVTNGVCDLVTKDASADVPVLQAWEQFNGSFLVERVIKADPINWWTSEVGVLSKGIMTMLVSPNASAHPTIAAKLCCDMVWDSGNQVPLVTYRDNAGGHAFLYKNGKIQPIYDNNDGKASQNIRAAALNGFWAVVGVSTLSQFRCDELLLINTNTLQIWSIAKTGTALAGLMPAGFGPGITAVGPEGTVYFGTGDLSNNEKFFAATILGVTGFLKPTFTMTADKTVINSGGTVTLTWSSTNATFVRINTQGGTFLPSGSLTLSLAATQSFTGYATGPAGDSDPVSVTVIVVPAAVPAFTANGVVSAADYSQQPFAPGTILSLFGSNLATATAGASLPLPITLAGTLVLVNNNPAPLFYVSPLQINFQLPYVVVGSSATVQVLTPLGISNLVTIGLTEFSPAAFCGPNGENLVDVTYHWATPRAVAGQVAIIYGTGFGAVSPSIPGGMPAPVSPLSILAKPISVTLCGQNAQVLWGGLAPGFVALYQVNVLVPAACSSVQTAKTPMTITATQ